MVYMVGQGGGGVVCIARLAASKLHPFKAGGLCTLAALLPPPKKRPTAHPTPPNRPNPQTTTAHLQLGARHGPPGRPPPRLQPGAAHPLPPEAAQPGGADARPGGGGRRRGAEMRLELPGRAAGGAGGWASCCWVRWFHRGTRRVGEVGVNLALPSCASHTPHPSHIPAPRPCDFNTNSNQPRQTSPLYTPTHPHPLNQ